MAYIRGIKTTDLLRTCEGWVIQRFPVIPALSALVIAQEKSRSAPGTNAAGEVATGHLEDNAGLPNPQKETKLAKCAYLPNGKCGSKTKGMITTVVRLLNSIKESM